ncbi:2,3,4,5-tetrahydropyridine-2,6-dicarboxylate N-acetyltransferase [Enterococcus saccharolyticus]|uniref:2,3,4,5-tetrahydropyridine-2,6-dicarboxylate N-acetyltransferase n=1 Tax=Candidatus Enterococcus willemsii TaxID=1857215 RepID=A0ABQ6YXQ1_9ENTE|nr:MULTISPECIES: 2,3,4,5-tetrahydropyridine-2,6-dicarboxylate N-acetyltransferase [Enterococcus]KAF1302754.1 2,3,4,5-tetrahydropyridine-2,6-dicarboxylate N-acetyltransferase [Enterococcus sp. CU12B]MCD5002432.1 2,3,4,5-tetrahydropyridine-2,6-dicarboxylate N-acetyltransferase [Enterococcus saccharolyticus]
MSNIQFTDAYKLAEFIKKATKQTPVKAYFNGDLTKISSDKVKIFGNIAIGEAEAIQTFLKDNQTYITDYYLENDRRNSAVPMLDLTSVDARIEPGAFIRDQAVIQKNAVVMMGAIINIGAVVGEESMIDMGAVLGARAVVGKRAHIGAGAVLAGVLEPPSASPVIIEDNVLVGANAVVLEGVHVGEGAVIAAGSIVTKDVPAHTVVAGSPAKIIKNVDEQTLTKTEFLDDLRG